jgi:hypothetical protein
MAVSSLPPTPVSWGDPRLAAPQCLAIALVRRGLGYADELHFADAGWPSALELLGREGLVVLGAAGLARGSGGHTGARALLRAQALLAARRHSLELEPLLQVVLRALDDHGVDAIVLKGGALAYQVYPTPASRSMVDVDLLVPDDQVERADAALRAIGLWTDAADYHPNHHLPPYHNPWNQRTVELHHRLLVEPHPFRIDHAALRARARLVELAGTRARVLAPEDALFLACVHLAASHRYHLAPLRTLVDVLAIATRWRAELDWERFVDLARRSRAGGAIYWPLRLARVWLGAPVPAQVLERIAPPVPLRRLVADALDPRAILARELPAEAGSDTLYELLLTLSLHSGCTIRQQAAALAGGLFPRGGEHDLRREVPVSASLSPREHLLYAAYLVSPSRVGRALSAVARVAASAANGRARGGAVHSG